MSVGYSYAKLDARAFCHDCGWECFARNSHGVGAQHSRKYDHYVTVEVISIYAYGKRKGEPQKTEAGS